MTIEKTLLIVGAGASKEANLPTGYELKKEIADYLDIRFEDGYSRSSGDPIITDSLRMQVSKSGDRDINSHLHACWRIRDGLPQAISIDNFIDTHNNDEKIELCGKLGIIRAILEAENRSLLNVDKSNIYNKPNFTALEDTWYGNFFKLLTENCTIENLEERLNSIAFIVFNYDRCIEQFLYYSFQNYYGVDTNEAARLVSIINIFHPYGVVGRLPWQDQFSIEFGGSPDPNRLLDLASQIKTFTEGTDPESSEIIAIRECVESAHKVIFLGFAYHKLNLALIKPENKSENRADKVSYFGTAKGISNSDCDHVRKELKDLIGGRQSELYIRNDLLCSSLFSEFGRSLSLS